MNPAWHNFLANQSAALAVKQSLQAANTISNLDHLGLLAVSGQDSAKFLQGQCTCDTNNVTSQKSASGAFCNPKGRVLANFRMSYADTTWLISLASDLTAGIQQQLEKFILFYQASIESASQDYVQLGLAGPQAKALIGEQLQQKLLGPHQVNDTYCGHELVAIKVAPATHGLPARWHVIASVKQAQALWQRACTQFNYQVATAASWQLMDIRAGLVQINQSTSALFTPHDLNLPAIQAVSFTKGCYTGQEIVARMHYRGKLKSHTYYGQTQGHAPKAPEPGDSLFIQQADKSHKKVGQVINVTELEPGHYELLALLPATQAEQQAIFYLTENQPVNLTIGSLVYAN